VQWTRERPARDTGADDEEPFLVLAAVLGVAGCGGGGNQTAAITEAVKSSPLSYFYYRNTTWWGKPVSVGRRPRRRDLIPTRTSAR
jgi:hypothetical protein